METYVLGERERERERELETGQMHTESSLLYIIFGHPHNPQGHTSYLHFACGHVSFKHTTQAIYEAFNAVSFVFTGARGSSLIYEKAVFPVVFLLSAFDFLACHPRNLRGISAEALEFWIF